MKKSAIALVVGGVVASQQALSEGSQPVFQVNKVVVNATRMEQEADAVARPLAIVEKPVLETIQPQSVAEALSYQPNIDVAGGPRANSQTVNIRGLEANKILQTIDGVRQVFESGHRPSYFLDPELLQSIEAIKGPASTLWGSGAVGGVVAQNTISAGDLLQADQNLGGFVKTGYNDNNHQSTTTAAIAGRVGSVDWLFSGYYRDSNDLEDGRGDTLLGSGSRDNGVLAKAEWQINDAHSVTFNYRQADVDGQVPSNGAAQITSTSNPLIEREQSTQNLSVDYRFDTESELVNGQVLAYWNQVEMDETRLSDGRADSTELDVLGLNINNLSRFGDIELLYGVDGYQESFDTQRGGSNRPQPPEAESEVWGGFVQANIPFAEVFRVEVGARYDYFATEAKNLGSDRSDNDLSPSVALVWQSTDWLELTLRHDQAFRAPSAEELYSTGTHFCMFPGFCNTFVANPDLDAEQAANTELLAKMQFTNLLGDDSLSITASVFENKVDDFIEQIVDDPTFFPVMSAGNTTWVNVDEASIEGFEVSANYQRDALAVVMSYGQTRGEDDKTGEDLTNIPADTFIADVSYGFFDRQLTAGVRVTVADDQHRTDYAENTAGTEYDSYSITDLYASWQPASWDAVKVDLTLNNVTDRDYRKAWANLDEAGREVIVSARYRF